MKQPCLIGIKTRLSICFWFCKAQNIEKSGKIQVSPPGTDIAKVGGAKSPKLENFLYGTYGAAKMPFLAIRSEIIGARFCPPMGRLGAQPQGRTSGGS